MTKKEYKRLTRHELLELLIEESEKAEELERQLKLANEKLASRELKIEKAGSIAEASLALNGIFEAAEASCAQYIENIKRLSALQDKINAEREAASRAKAEEIINEANQRAGKIEAETRSRCKELLLQTQEVVLMAKQSALKTDDN